MSICSFPWYRPLFGLLALVLASSLALVSVAESRPYQLIDLGLNVTPQDINDSGKLVGFKRNPDYTTVGVIYYIATGTLQDIAGTGTANAINNAGVIAGTTANGAFYMNGTLVYLGDYYSAQGINELSDIAGSKSNDNPYRAVPRPINPAVYDFSSQLWNEIEVARLYSRGTELGVYADLYTLMDINDAGYAVGNYRKYGLTTAYGFVVSPDLGTVLTPIPGSNSTAEAINEQGLIVGGTVVEGSDNPYRQAYAYDLAAEQITILGALEVNLLSTALDINEVGQVVGYSMTSSQPYPRNRLAFIWQDGVMRDLNALIPADSGWILAVARAINDRGDIVGTGWRADGSHGFLLLRTDESLADPQPERTAPVAVISADPMGGIVPLVVSFDGTESHDVDGEIVSYEWDLGDGTTSTTSTANQVDHVYDVAGTYTATLTVTDDDGLAGEGSVVISVLPRQGQQVRNSR